MLNNQVNKKWLLLAIILLTLFCLNQNRAVVNLVIQPSSQIQTLSLTSEAVVADKLAPYKLGKTCELSEKSLRLCLDNQQLMPIVLLFFTLSLSLVLFTVFCKTVISKIVIPPERIYLAFCRFQE